MYFLLSGLLASNKEFTIERTILNKSAYQNPSTVKPGTNFPASIIMNAFITNRNNPKENIVIGKVSMIKTGLTNELSTARTAATPIAVTMFSTLTPGSKKDETNTANPVTNIFIRKRMWLFVDRKMQRFCDFSCPTSWGKSR